MLHEAQLASPLKGDAVQCRVCEHRCALQPGVWR